MIELGQENPQEITEFLFAIKHADPYYAEADSREAKLAVALYMRGLVSVSCYPFGPAKMTVYLTDLGSDYLNEV